MAELYNGWGNSLQTVANNSYACFNDQSQWRPVKLLLTKWLQSEDWMANLQTASNNFVESNIAYKWQIFRLV